MTIYDWPLTLFPQAQGFNPRGMVVGGPPSLTGRTMVGSIDAGYWTATLAGFVVNTKDRVKGYRALRALLEGGAHQVRMPVFDCRHAPWPVDISGRSVSSAGPVQFSDGSEFSDGSSLYQPIITAETVGDTALRSTLITINFLNVGEVVGGEYFSIGDRLYVIKSVIEEDDTELTLSIWPPLREVVADGTPVNFDRPACLMRLADEATMDLMLESGRRAFPDLSFVEVFGG
jgi:hypothetical protein